MEARSKQAAQVFPGFDEAINLEMGCRSNPPVA